MVKKTLLLVVKIFALLAAVVGVKIALAIASDDWATRKWAPRTYNAEPIRIEMGQYFYDIPAHYFDMQPHSDCNSGGELLIGLLPDLEGRTKENNKAFNQRGWWRNQAMILIGVNADPDTGWTAEQSMEGIYKNLIEREVEGPLNPKSRHPFLGLDYYGSAKMRRKDVLVKLSDKGMPQTLVTCNTPGSVPFPGCGQFFADADLVIKISYSREFLPHWEEIQRKAKVLLASMRKEKVSNPSKACKQTF
jgi:hypothetical protein